MKQQSYLANCRKIKTVIKPIEEKDLVHILSIYNETILNTIAVYTYKPDTLDNRRVRYEQKLKAWYPELYTTGKRRLFSTTFGPIRAWPFYKYSIEHSIYVDCNYLRSRMAAILLKDE